MSLTSFKSVWSVTTLYHSAYALSTYAAFGFTSVTSRQGTAQQVIEMIRSERHIENILHWRRDVTLREDACQVSRGQLPSVLATMNNLVLFLIDRTGSRNAAAAIRRFAAHPAKALALIMTPT